METKIASYKTFEVSYDLKRKTFIARNAEGDEVGSCSSQAVLEKQLDALAKQKWTFPISAFDSKHLIIEAGRITSCNPDDKSCYFVADEDEVTGRRQYGSGRSKQRLTYSSLYEVTPHNEEIFVKVKDKRRQVKKLQDAIGELQKGMEKPIDLEYFGIKDHY